MRTRASNERLNETIKYYAANKEQPRAFYSNGRQFYFGVRLKL